MGELAASCLHRSLPHPLTAITLKFQDALHISDLLCLEGGLWVLLIQSTPNVSTFQISHISCLLPCPSNSGIFHFFLIWQKSLKGCDSQTGLSVGWFLTEAIWVSCMVKENVFSWILIFSIWNLLYMYAAFSFPVKPLWSGWGVCTFG